MGSACSRRKAVVWLVEPHPLADRYVRGLLQRKGALRVVADPGAHTRKADPADSPALLLVDIDTLPLSLATYLRMARYAFPQARILAMGRTLPAEELCRLLFLGISGFVPYDKVEQEITAAVEAVLGGHLWAAPQVLERYVTYSSALSNPKTMGRRAFTSRESAIIGLLQRRLSNKEIGSALGVSERTVRFHLQNIFDKLGVRDRYSVAEITKSTEPAGRAPHPGIPVVQRDG